MTYLKKNSLLPNMGLSSRLAALYQVIPEHYYHDIWDLCCDHGKLGVACLNKAEQIYLCDIQAHLCQQLQQQCQFELNHLQSRLHIIHGDARKLDVMSLSKTSDSTAYQLLIIAGVGGDLGQEILQHQRLKSSPESLTKQRHYLLCVNYHHYALRHYCHNAGFSLLSDQLIKDGKHYYEIIYLADHAEAAQPINPVGNFWQPDQPEQQAYLNIMLKHYQNRCRNKHPSPLDQAAWRDYQTLAKRLDHYSAIS